MSMSVPAYVYVCLSGSDVFNLFGSANNLQDMRPLLWAGGGMVKKCSL